MEDGDISGFSEQIDTVALKPKITVFFCVNTFPDEGAFAEGIEKSFEMNAVQIACSGMVKDVVLLKAFEAGADSVMVMVCPEGSCRYLNGNIRAKKRVQFVKRILKEIGLGENRLNIYNIASGDKKGAIHAFQNILSDLNRQGESPIEK
ncbi:MAG: hydrogenase iron-sulfur subunit [Pseudomonadota bacterium]